MSDDPDSERGPVRALAETIRSEARETPARTVPLTAHDDDSLTLRRDGAAPGPANDALPADLPAFVGMLGVAAFDTRYEASELLGRGGMGEVRLYLDRRIGRDVAHKTLRKDVRASTIGLERFVREARVQGQLEHPAVLPVYDLGVDPEGQVFFTMKRVRGTPLDAVLDALAAGDADAQARYSRRRLLTAFVQVCRAIDFAHSRGVLHRDLKPGNVMLGEYGEVHVLDWGLAKIVGKHERVGDVPVAPEHSGDSGSTPTLAGSVLGTPGYMSPEQARGETDGLDGRTDVYALGAMLFEIVFREALHEGPGAAARLSSTLIGPEMRASHRGRGVEVPPELEAICQRACTLDADYRTPSARALADEVERFLDGERDDERRKELAKKHVASAEEALARAAAGDEAARGEALRELGRALVLDPTHDAALRSLEAALTDVPARPPPAAAAAIEDSETRQRASLLRAMAVRHALWMLISICLFVLFPLRSVPLATTVLASVAALAALNAWVAYRRPASRAWWTALVVGTAALVGLLSVAFGPFVFVPALAATYTVLYAPQTSRFERRLLHTSLALAVSLPAVLGELGVVPHMVSFQADGAMLMRSPLFALDERTTLPVLVAANVLPIVIPGTLGGRFFDRLRVLEARAIVQATMLRGLLPRRHD